MSYILHTFGLVALVALAACTHPGPAPLAYQLEPGRPLEAVSSYDTGMGEGCPSGENAAGNPWKRWTKNSQRYARDEQYKQGWDDGFARCKGQYEAVGRALR